MYVCFMNTDLLSFWPQNYQKSHVLWATYNKTRFNLEMKLVCHPFSLLLQFVASNEIIFKK